MTPEPQALVVDASIAIRFLKREPGWEDARDRLRSARLPDGRLLVPSAFWLEVLNVLARRYRLTPKTILQAIAELDALELETVDLDRPMLLLALDAVARHGLTAYDAAYLALAEWADAGLLTADARVAAAAGDRAQFVGDGLPPPVMAEAPAAYAATWADWPGAAAYLRRLRTRVAETA